MQTDKNNGSQAVIRLSYLFDDGIFTEINSAVKEKEELASVVTAFGYVNGNPVYAFSQDKSLNSGAVGTAHADKINKLYNLAAKTGAPIVGIYDSNGAVIDGTAASLEAYGKMLCNASIISGVVPQIAVITGACVGSAAMLACSSDFVVMTKDSEFFMAPSDSESGAADAALKAGIAAAVCDDDKAAVEKAKEILNLLPINNLAQTPIFEYDETNTLPGASLDSIISSITDADSTVELFDGCGETSYTALASIGGSAVGIAATNKKNGKLTADDSAKLARFIRVCDAFTLPVITIIDTEGFDSTNGTLDGIKDMTRLVNCYAEATTVKISVVTGKAIGPAFIALAGKNVNADFTYAWNNAVIAPLNPLTAVEFLWHDKLKGTSDVKADREKLALEYEITLASAESAASIGAVDEVIAPENTRKVLVDALDILAGKRVSNLPKKHSNMPF